MSETTKNISVSTKNRDFRRKRSFFVCGRAVFLKYKMKRMSFFPLDNFDFPVYTASKWICFI